MPTTTAAVREHAVVEMKASELAAACVGSGSGGLLLAQALESMMTTNHSTGAGAPAHAGLGMARADPVEEAPAVGRTSDY